MPSKLVEEEVQIGFDFLNQDEIAVFGETIATVVSVAFTPTDANLIINSKGSPTISGTQVLVWVKGGSSLQTYTGLCLVTTSGGKTIGSQMPLNMLD